MRPETSLQTGASTIIDKARKGFPVLVKITFALSKRSGRFFCAGKSGIKRVFSRPVIMRNDEKIGVVKFG